MNFLRIVFLLFFSLPALACDLCGSYMGITPYDNQSQLTLLHRYRVFNGYRNYQQSSRFLIPGAYKTMHDPSIIAGDSTTEIKNHSSKDYETYKVIELRGKYFLHLRWEMNFILPVQQIKTKYDEDRNINSGMADPSLFLGYHIIKRLSGFAIKQRMIIGGGIKLPLGVSNKKNSEDQRMQLLNQNGTGSFDHFYYINYMVSKKWWGVNTNCIFKFNGTNKFNERYANSYNQVLSLFVKLEIKDLSIYPSVFMNYEYCKGLYLNKNLVKGTNVNVLLVGPSIDVNYKGFVLNTSYQFNGYERVSSQSLSNAGRFVIGLTYNFNQNKYLIKNKD
ncbi:MAG: hypothetical protein JNJ40_01730 [Bacteroidia bacterium]|nr:hypothetical protein [Bacteroidia bacterium]